MTYEYVTCPAHRFLIIYYWILYPTLFKKRAKQKDFKSSKLYFSPILLILLLLIYKPSGHVVQMFLSLIKHNIFRTVALGKSLNPSYQQRVYTYKTELIPVAPDNTVQYGLMKRNNWSI